MYKIYLTSSLLNSKMHEYEFFAVSWELVSALFLHAQTLYKTIQVSGMKIKSKNIRHSIEAIASKDFLI